MNTLIVALTAVTLGAPIPANEVKKQNESFEELWDARFVWKLDELPAKGGVEKFRVPYSGYIYPDRSGGTKHILRKYDRAFHRGRSLASSHEQWDTTAFKEPAKGIFGGRALFGRMEVPDWYGHCNGWTAASIRHAEPQKSVTVNGVRFSPSDVKALLAEIYIYNDHNVLAGDEGAPINAGLFHAIMANWIGRGEHPLGMEEDPTKEKWNYPVYAYATSSAKHSSRRVEVKMNIAYALDSDGEWDESPRIKEVKYFHYMLELNRSGHIVGGYFFRDSSMIDMLWVPLLPKASGQEGNEAGNPYVNVNQVLAIWRASVSKETREKWVTVDAPEADKVALRLDGEETTPVFERSIPVDTSEIDSETPAETEPSEEDATTGEPQIPRVEIGTSDSDNAEETDEESTAQTESPSEDPNATDPPPAPLDRSNDEVETDTNRSANNTDSDSKDVAPPIDLTVDEASDGMSEEAGPLPVETFVE